MKVKAELIVSDPFMQYSCEDLALLDYVRVSQLLLDGDI